MKFEQVPQEEVGESQKLVAMVQEERNLFDSLKEIPKNARAVMAALALITAAGCAEQKGFVEVSSHLQAGEGTELSWQDDPWEGRIRVFGAKEAGLTVQRVRADGSVYLGQPFVYDSKKNGKEGYADLAETIRPIEFKEVAGNSYEYRETFVVELTPREDEHSRHFLALRYYVVDPATRKTTAFLGEFRTDLDAYKAISKMPNAPQELKKSLKMGVDNLENIIRGERDMLANGILEMRGGGLGFVVPGSEIIENGSKVHTEIRSVHFFDENYVEVWKVGEKGEATPLPRVHKGDPDYERFCKIAEEGADKVYSLERFKEVK